MFISVQIDKEIYDLVTLITTTKKLEYPTKSNFFRKALVEKLERDGIVLSKHRDYGF